MKSKYELHLSSILKIENEELRERLKDLKEEINKLNVEILKLREKYEKDISVGYNRY